MNTLFFCNTCSELSLCKTRLFFWVPLIHQIHATSPMYMYKAILPIKAWTLGPSNIFNRVRFWTGFLWILPSSMVAKQQPQARIIHIVLLFLLSFMIILSHFGCLLTCRIKDRYLDHMLVVAEEIAGFDLSLWLISSFPFQSSHYSAQWLG